MLSAESFSYCTVPNSGQDALLFGSVAVLVTVVLQGKLSAVWVLIAGACCSCSNGCKPATGNRVRSCGGFCRAEAPMTSCELCQQW